MVPVLAAIALPLLLGACASGAPPRYEHLASSPQLKPESADKDGRVSYAYKGDPSAFARHRTVYLEAVTVYRGADHRFGGLTEQEKADLAAAAAGAFKAALSQQGLLTAMPAPDALRLRITLTGAEINVPILSTATKLAPVGLAINGLKAMADREANFTGAVTYAVEFRDGPSNTLLWAFVTREFPSALDIPASLGPLDAAKAALRDGARSLARDMAARLGQNPPA